MYAKVVLLFAVVVVAIAAPSSKKSEKLLGTFTNRQNVTSQYTIVIGRRPYDEALRNCIDPRYPGRALASLETEEEERFVMDLIMEDAWMERVWFGSQWDGNGSFIWESGVPFRDNVQWMPEIPRFGDNTTRVAFWFYNMTSAGFITQEDNNILNSLCEYHAEN